MIPLRIKAEAPEASQPFVVRLGDDPPTGTPLTANAGAQLLCEASDGLEYNTGYGALRLSNISAAEIDGDILLVVPQRRIAHRLIRARSLHNTFLVTEQCDQLCVMCSQPPKSHHVNLFPYFERAAMLAPHGAVIGLSGGEPTLHKGELFAFLARVLERRPDLQFHVLTNAQHVETGDVEALRRLPCAAVTRGVPLYAELGLSHFCFGAASSAKSGCRTATTIAKGLSRVPV